MPPSNTLLDLLNRKDKKKLKNEPLNQNILGPYNKGNEPYDTGYTSSDIYNWESRNTDRPINLGNTGSDDFPSRHSPVYDENHRIPNDFMGSSSWNQLYKVPWNSETNSIDPDSADRRFFNMSTETGINNREFNKTNLNRNMHREVYRNQLNPSDSLNTQQVYDILSNDKNNMKFHDESYGKYLK